MKTRQVERPAERPESKALILTIRLRPELVPLFKAGMLIMEAKSVERFAEWAIIKGITSDVLMERFDEMVNRLL